MTTRRLAAILAADVVGFSPMMEKMRRGRFGLDSVPDFLHLFSVPDQPT